MSHWLFRTLTLAAFCAASHPAAAQSSDAADEIFRGKTIKLIVPTGPGGAYGLYGLLFAQHYGRHLPGEPVVVPEYRAGAGGMVAANYLYSVAPRDGSVISIPLAPIILAQYTGGLRSGMTPRSSSGSDRWRTSRACLRSGKPPGSSVSRISDPRQRCRHDREGLGDVHQSGHHQPRIRHEDQNRGRLQGLSGPVACARTGRNRRGVGDLEQLCRQPRRMGERGQGPISGADRTFEICRATRTSPCSPISRRMSPIASSSNSCRSSPPPSDIR